MTRVELFDKKRDSSRVELFDKKRDSSRVITENC